ncbi:MAG: response regulator transcription factor [Anaerolineales bacterium]|nr:MAG: response regulator transcription factor [Anaerolineales bacterium]
MAEKPIQILIVDDHAVVRKGVRALLATEPSIEIIGEAGDGEQALQLYQELKPDLLLLDLLMPKMNGVEVIKSVKKIDKGAKILVLTSFAADDQVFPAIKAGALGYLLKDTEPDDLVSAIQQVFLGESSLSPIVARMLLDEIFQSGEKPISPDPLTKREIEVLQVLAKGKSNREIGSILSISETTVRSHVSNILAKLHLASRMEAALYAIKEGVANLED